MVHSMPQDTSGVKSKTGLTKKIGDHVFYHLDVKTIFCNDLQPKCKNFNPIKNTSFFLQDIVNKEYRCYTYFGFGLVCSLDATECFKGKLFERVGRKAMNLTLSREIRMVVWPP